MSRQQQEPTEATSLRLDAVLERCRNPRPSRCLRGQRQREGGVDVKHAWEPLARLVLEAAYEDMLLAGMLNVLRGASRRVLLKRLGGGAFGNDPAWTASAIERALARVAGQGIEYCW